MNETEAPQALQDFYELVVAIRGWVLFPLMIIFSIVILIRGFAMWRQSKGDWEAVFKSLQSVLAWLSIVVIAFSITNLYDWLRNTDLGGNLPDLSQQEEG